MLFPDGRLPSRRWLPVAVIGGLATLGIVLPNALVNTLPVRDVSGRGIANPIGIEDLGKIEDLPIFGVSETLFLGAAVGAVASVVVRFRRSRGAERQQMKMFAYVIVVLMGGSVLAGTLSDLIGVGWLGGSSFVLSMIGLMCLPMAVGIAILRYRLYEIDIIINRTLVYGPLTATLALVYFGGWRRPSSCSGRSQANISNPNSP
jgi:drug/metabolite transporter (DMT)-like permease